MKKRIFLSCIVINFLFISTDVNSAVFDLNILKNNQKRDLLIASPGGHGDGGGGGMKPADKVKRKERQKKAQEQAKERIFINEIIRASKAHKWSKQDECRYSKKWGSKYLYEKTIELKNNALKQKFPDTDNVDDLLEFMDKKAKLLADLDRIMEWITAIRAYDQLINENSPLADDVLNRFLKNQSVMGSEIQKIFGAREKSNDFPDDYLWAFYKPMYEAAFLLGRGYAGLEATKCLYSMK